MNATLSTERGRHQPPPPAVDGNDTPNEHAHRPAALARLPRDEAPIERLALRVGLALIRWGRRRGTGRVPGEIDGETVQMVRVNRDGVIAREHAAELAYRLTIPFR